MKLRIHAQFPSSGYPQVKLFALDEQKNQPVAAASVIFRSIDDGEVPMQLNVKAMSPDITFEQLAKINAAFMELVISIQAGTAPQNRVERVEV